MPLTTRLKRLTPYRVKDAIRPPWPEASRRYVEGSFSQAGEDRIVRFLFNALGVPHPTYLDIGAHHPFHINNTALLHLGGSRGINVDPDPAAMALFARHRPQDINLTLGVAAEAGELSYFRMSEPSLNSCSEEAAKQAEVESGGAYRIESVTTVEVTTVGDVLRQHWGGGCPDFISLDVEGLDLAIVRTMPDWPARPMMMCVETLTYSGRRRNEKIPEIKAHMSDLGFVEFADTFLNTIFLRDDVWTPLD